MTVRGSAPGRNHPTANWDKRLTTNPHSYGCAATRAGNSLVFAIDYLEAKK